MSVHVTVVSNVAWLRPRFKAGITLCPRLRLRPRFAYILSATLHFSRRTRTHKRKHDANQPWTWQLSSVCVHVCVCDHLQCWNNARRDSVRSVVFPSCQEIDSPLFPLQLYFGFPKPCPQAADQSVLGFEGCRHKQSCRKQRIVLPTMALHTAQAIMTLEVCLMF